MAVGGTSRLETKTYNGLMAFARLGTGLMDRMNCSVFSYLLDFLLRRRRPVIRAFFLGYKPLGF